MRPCTWRAWGLPYQEDRGPGAAAAAEAERDVLGRMEQQVESLRKTCPMVEVTLDPVRSAPAIALARTSERSDLMIVGARGLGGFHGLALGSVSHAVLDTALCPVAVVPGQERQGTLDESEECVMKAVVGDRLRFLGHKVGDHDRMGRVLEVLGSDGGPPYLVEFEDGHRGEVFPGPDCELEPQQGHDSGHSTP